MRQHRIDCGNQVQTNVLNSPHFTCNYSFIPFSTSPPFLFLLLPLSPAHFPWVCRALQFLHPHSQSGTPWFTILSAASFTPPGSGACSLLVHQSVCLGGLLIVIVSHHRSYSSDNPAGINIPTFSSALVNQCEWSDLIPITASISYPLASWQKLLTRHP